MSKIEWTEQTWNPIVGCSVTSPGCTNCYAMGMAARIERMGGAPQYDGLTTASKAGPVFNGKVALAEKALLAPLTRKTPTMYFVNSMGDLFHENVPDEWIDRVFAVMALTPHHTYQVLTKRSARMREYVSGKGFPEAVLHAVMSNPMCPGSGETSWPLPNVWLGVSTEDQTRADERIRDLLDTPAAVRFASYEPALGPIDWTYIKHQNPPTHIPKAHTNALVGYGHNNVHTKLDWIICGGESGKNARPMHPDWARQTRDQCAEAGTAFFFKQWGEWTPGENVPADRLKGSCQDATWFGGSWDFDKTRMADPEDKWDQPADLYRIGKKAAGRTLDGTQHDQFPTHP